MTQRNKKTRFLSPIFMALAMLVLLVSLAVVAFRYFPILTLAAIVITAILAKLFVKRKHLTFFTDEYDADIFTGKIEADREADV